LRLRSSQELAGVIRPLFGCSVIINLAMCPVSEQPNGGKFMYANIVYWIECKMDSEIFYALNATDETKARAEAQRIITVIFKDVFLNWEFYSINSKTQFKRILNLNN
jgi:hypothetical protein